MIKINYGTSAHFEENIGDKYYCKTLSSAKKKLKKLTALNVNGITFTVYDYDLVVRKFDERENQISVKDLYIYIEEINLI